MTQMLMEFETLDSKDVKEIMDHSWDSEKKRARMKEEGMLYKKVSEDLPPPPPQENVQDGTGLKFNTTTSFQSVVVKIKERVLKTLSFFLLRIEM